MTRIYRHPTEPDAVILVVELGTYSDVVLVRDPAYIAAVERAQLVLPAASIPSSEDC